MMLTSHGHLSEVQLCAVCGGIGYATRVYPRLALQEFQCIDHHLTFQRLPPLQPYASVTQYRIAEQTA